MTSVGSCTGSGPAGVHGRDDRGLPQRGVAAGKDRPQAATGQHENKTPHNPCSPPPAPADSTAAVAKYHCKIVLTKNTLQFLLSELSARNSLAAETIQRFCPPTGTDTPADEPAPNPSTLIFSVGGGRTPICFRRIANIGKLIHRLFRVAIARSRRRPTRRASYAILRSPTYRGQGWMVWVTAFTCLASPALIVMVSER